MKSRTMESALAYKISASKATVDELRAENAKLRAALSQIVTACDVNAGPTAKHALALKIVRDIAAHAASR